MKLNIKIIKGSKAESFKQDIKANINRKEM